MKMNIFHIYTHIVCLLSLLDDNITGCNPVNCNICLREKCKCVVVLGTNMDQGDADPTGDLDDTTKTTQQNSEFIIYLYHLWY